MILTHAEINCNLGKKRTRPRLMKAARKGSLRAVCLSPIEEGETFGGNCSARALYNETLALLRAPATKLPMPYDPSSEAGDRNLRRIIYHYTTTIVSSSLCAGPKRRFFPAALQDETLFRAMIFSTAMHASWCQGIPIPPEVYHHRAQAIRLINEKLSSKFIEPVAFDNMINTIFFMLITESFDGAPEILRIHWEGLIQLLQMAGGLERLGLSGITRRNALWFIIWPVPYILVDLATAMILKEKPRLHPPYSGIQLFDYFGLQSPGTSCLATVFNARMCVFTGSKELSQQASTVLWGLRSISGLQRLRKMEAFINTAGPDEIQYSDRTEALERVLVPLWCAENGKYKRAGILRMFAWASLIYLYADLRDAPKGMSLYGRLADRIRVEMEECRELDCIYETFPDLMLWVLFLGGRGACVDSKRYFARAAAKILAPRGFVNELDVKAASQAFLWPIDRTNQIDWDSPSQRRSKASLTDLDTKEVG